MAEATHSTAVRWHDPGWRGLVGFISPPSPSLDPIDFIRIAPDGFRVLQTMTYVPAWENRAEKMAEAAKQLEYCCLALKQAGVDIIAQSGTPFSFVSGGFDVSRELHARLVPAQKDL